MQGSACSTTTRTFDELGGVLSLKAGGSPRLIYRLTVVVSSVLTAGLSSEAIT
jgi:hypothetical protein